MASHKKHLFSLLSLFHVLLLSVVTFTEVQAEAHVPHHHHWSKKKLFVFGDSYADTGNTPRGTKAWNHPYGTTFPGKPAGRFSDGRILTDYIAMDLKVKSPVPHGMMREKGDVKHGMNFAFGGTGVFDTLVPGPNMTTQIDVFQSLININTTHNNNKLYSKSQLANSIALLSVAGNDYGNYIATNGSLQDVPSFIELVVNQTAMNMRRIHEMGVKKIAVTSLPPLGCLPFATVTSSFQACNQTYNMLALLHNAMLSDAVTTLNMETKVNFTFVMLDLYDTFMSVLNGWDYIENENGHIIRFRPCCVGVSSEYSCGSVDQNYVKKYSVCDDPQASFFWDNVHTTEAAWHAVFTKLRNTTQLQQLHY